MLTESFIDPSKELTIDSLVPNFLPEISFRHLSRKITNLRDAYIQGEVKTVWPIKRTKDRSQLKLLLQQDRSSKVLPVFFLGKSAEDSQQLAEGDLLGLSEISIEENVRQTGNTLQWQVTVDPDLTQPKVWILHRGKGSSVDQSRTDVVSAENQLEAGPSHAIRNDRQMHARVTQRDQTQSHAVQNNQPVQSRTTRNDHPIASHSKQNDRSAASNAQVPVIQSDPPAASPRKQNIQGRSQNNPTFSPPKLKRTYEYTLLRDLEANDTVNIHAVVQNVRSSRVTSSGQLCKTIELIDESTHGTTDVLLCTFFRNNENEFYSFEVGDIIRIHRLKIGFFNNRFTGIVYKACAFLVFNGQVGASMTPYTPSLTYTMEQVDTDRVCALREFMANPPTGQPQAQSVPVYNLDTCDLANCEIGKYFNLICQVIGIYKQKPNEEYVLQVWDGTLPTFPLREEDYLKDVDYLNKLRVDKDLQARAGDYLVHVRVLGIHALRADALQCGDYIKLNNLYVSPCPPRHTSHSTVQANEIVLKDGGRRYDRRVILLESRSRDAMQLQQDLLAVCGSGESSQEASQDMCRVVTPDRCEDMEVSGVDATQDAGESICLSGYPGQLSTAQGTSDLLSSARGGMESLHLRAEPSAQHRCDSTQTSANTTQRELSRLGSKPVKQHQTENTRPQTNQSLTLMESLNLCAERRQRSQDRPPGQTSIQHVNSSNKAVDAPFSTQVDQNGNEEDEDQMNISSTSLRTNAESQDTQNSQPTATVLTAHHDRPLSKLCEVSSHPAPYKFRTICRIRDYMPKPTTPMELVKLYCKRCDYIGPVPCGKNRNIAENEPIRLKTLSSKIQKYSCPHCCKTPSRHVLDYVMMMQFLLEDSTDSIVAGLWKTDADVFFHGTTATEIMLDPEAFDFVRSNLKKLCPPTQSGGTQPSESQKDSPLIECCVKSYSKTTGTYYQIFATCVTWTDKDDSLL